MAHTHKRSTYDRSRFNLPQMSTSSLQWPKPNPLGPHPRECVAALDESFQRNSFRHHMKARPHPFLPARCGMLGYPEWYITTIKTLYSFTLMVPVIAMALGMLGQAGDLWRDFASRGPNCKRFQAAWRREAPSDTEHCRPATVPSCAPSLPLCVSGRGMLHASGQWCLQRIPSMW